MNMKRFLAALLVGTVCAAAQAQIYTSEDGFLHVDLKKAIDIALDENPTIRIAEKDIELKKIADKEAWQALLPEISVTGTLQHTLLAAEMKLGGNSFKMGQDNTNTVNVAAALNVPLFAPAVYQNMKLTKEDIRLAEEKARGSKLDLINQVTKAYYSALLAQDSYEVMKQSYETSRLNYQIISERFRVGKVSEYDKLSAEVQMRSMNATMVSAENGQKLALLQLKVLMGVTANVGLTIDDELENYESNVVIPQILDQERQLLDNSVMRQFDLNRALLDRSYKNISLSTIKDGSSGIILSHQVPTLWSRCPSQSTGLPTGQSSRLSNYRWRNWKTIGSTRSETSTSQPTAIGATCSPASHRSTATALRWRRLKKHTTFPTNDMRWEKAPFWKSTKARPRSPKRSSPTTSLFMIISPISPTMITPSDGRLI